MRSRQILRPPPRRTPYASCSGCSWLPTQCLRHDIIRAFLALQPGHGVYNDSSTPRRAVAAQARPAGSRQGRPSRRGAGETVRYTPPIRSLTSPTSNPRARASRSPPLGRQHSHLSSPTATTPCAPANGSCPGRWYTSTSSSSMTPSTTARLSKKPLTATRSMRFVAAE